MTYFFPKKLDFSRKSWIFSQNVSQLHRNLTWGFLGFFSVARLGFLILLEWQRWQDYISCQFIEAVIAGKRLWSVDNF